MRLRLLLALFLSASLFLVGSAVFADDDDDHAAPAMQVMIDEKTGKKTEREDDAGNTPSMVTTGIVDTGRNSNISAMMPAKSQPPQYHADGSISAQLGLEHFKYLVVTKNENGEPVMTHLPAGQLEAEDLPEAADREEE